MQVYLHFSRIFSLLPMWFAAVRQSVVPGGGPAVVLCVNMLQLALRAFSTDVIAALLGQ